MAARTTTTKKTTTKKVSSKISESNITFDELVAGFDSLQEKDKTTFFNKVGIGGTSVTGKYYTCYLCGKPLARSKFHVSSDPNCASGVARVCKKCLEEISHPIGEDGERTSPTKESLKLALEYADKPYFQNLFESSLWEAANQITGKTKNDVYTSYIKNIAMQQYENKRWRDGDLFGGSSVSFNSDDKDMPQESREMYEINKKTTIRFLGYDPFEHEPLSEQPLLYAKLVNYFDDSVKDDGLKLEAVIEIVQSFKDIKTINDAISKYKKQLGENPQVIATIKSLADTKQKMINSTLALAKDNGISVNHNNQKSKGAGTLSGLIKEMSEMNLDAIEINTFDYETSQAISEIMDMNFQNQMKQLNPDENDWEKEVFHQAKLLKQLQKERDQAVECCRLLRKENKDLKDFMIEREIITPDLEVIE